MEETRFGRIWANWENALASVQHDGPVGESPAEYARAFARLENHYFQNGGFLEEDGWILQQRHRIEHIPAKIVQGRLDMICPPLAAWRLAEGWDKARSADRAAGGTCPVGTGDFGRTGAGDGRAEGVVSHA